MFWGCHRNQSKPCHFQINTLMSFNSASVSVTGTTALWDVLVSYPCAGFGLGKVNFLHSS